MGGEWSASWTNRVLWIRSRCGRFLEKRKSLLAFEPPTTQPLASRYTKYDISAPAGDGVYCKNKKCEHVAQ
jgi:hypothetical protein